MEIIQSFYYSPNSSRQTEMDHTLHMNLNKDFIHKIHLFIDASDYNRFIVSFKDKNYSKIHFVNYKGQPKYPDLFNYCSRLDNIICCICNSDIEFFIDNIKILQPLYNQKLIYFLTRHEYDNSCPLIKKFGGSHDAFIFHSNTLPTFVDFSYINYIQNTCGIEALLTIFFIEQLKYKILNPCLQIKLIHHHKSEIRLWNKNHKIIGYSSPKPLPFRSGIHSKYLIYPSILS